MKKAKKPPKSKKPAAKAAKPSAKSKPAKKTKPTSSMAKMAKKLASKLVKSIAAKKPEKTPAKAAKVSKPVKPEVVAKATPIKPAGKVATTKVAKTDKAVKITTPPPAAPAKEEIVLTDAEGRRYCRVRECDQIAAVDMYCRLHYLMYWKKIQLRKKILSEGQLESYIEELTARFPDKYLEMIRKDLRSEKDFLAAIQELEIDESTETEFEDDQSYIEEVRGISGEPAERQEEEF